MSSSLLDCDFYSWTDFFADLYKGASTESEELPHSSALSQPGGTDWLPETVDVVSGSFESFVLLLPQSKTREAKCISFILTELNVIHVCVYHDEPHGGQRGLRLCATNENHMLTLCFKVMERKT